MNNKILITGVGGSGSGFIIRCLENCGLDTGGYNSYFQHGPVRQLEAEGMNPRDIEIPRVIKHLGGFMKNLNTYVDKYNWQVDHIFLAVTPYEFQLDKYRKRRGYSNKEAKLRYFDSLSQFMIQVIERDYKVTLVRCPESILNPEYLYSKLKIILPESFSINQFKKAHEKTISLRHKQRLIDKTKVLKYDKIH